jgi:soluble lytic murein transglycosylase-like protein
MNELILSGFLTVSLLGGGFPPALSPGAGMNLGVDSQASSSDAALNSVRQSDREARRAAGGLLSLTPSEHMRRASVYLSNRIFDAAREHWTALLQQYPHDVNAPAAIFGIGRSFFVAGRYLEAAPYFERVAGEYPNTKEGRDGLSSHASSLLRAGKPADAAGKYIEYTERYPAGDRIESSYLNVIDAYREAGQIADALKWVEITRNKYRGTPTEVNAVFARLRLDVSAGDWRHATQTADEIRGLRFQAGVNTSPDEVTYLKAYSLERSGRIPEAIAAYSAIPDSSRSFYGMLATERLQQLGSPAVQPMVADRLARVRQQIREAGAQYPAPYRDKIVQESSRRNVDPRLVLSIMRQESSFRPWIKSPAAARGLLQLTIDTAARYSAGAGIRNVNEADLYRPDTSISIGAEALADLQRKFPNLPEAVAASYNGGDDNVARWVKRMHQKDRGVFTAEVGFTETKDYVSKVLTNYRAYSELYTDNLRLK